MHLGCPRFYKSLVPKRESVQRTVCEVLRRHVGNILGKDDSKATRLARQHNSTITYRSTDHERVQVPVNVAVEEPRARVVREEPDRDIITGVADAHDVAEDRVLKVVRGVTSTAYNSERMSMQVNGMLLGEESSKLVRPYRQMPARNTHRSAEGTSWDGQFDALVRPETVDAACGN
jgi:hypothetical protein